MFCRTAALAGFASFRNMTIGNDLANAYHHATALPHEFILRIKMSTTTTEGDTCSKICSGVLADASVERKTSVKLAASTG